MSLNPGATNAGVTSRCFITGDIDVHGDFTLFDWPPNNLRVVKLAAADLGTGMFGLVGVERFSGAVESYHMVLLNSTAGFTVTTDTGGKLRLVRSGATLTGFSHDWTTFRALASTAVGMDPMRFTLNVGSFNPNADAVTVAFDNFRINAGSVSRS